MSQNVFSIRRSNAFGNMAIGACLIALGVMRLLNPDDWLTLGAAICLLAIAGLALYVCLSPRRETPDEMAVAHDGMAAGHALRITLIVASLGCAVSMFTNAKVDLAGVGLGFVGVSLFIYGAAFAWLER